MSIDDALVYTSMRLLWTEARVFPGIPESGTPSFSIRVGRVGRPDEVADMAIAMLRNGYLTNKAFTLDGGIVPRN
jgi:3-oxoacyl-[acyl-carrier protein] reductase